MINGPVRRVVLCNPPGRLLLRGEGRCDDESDKATASWAYPPMNLAYAAACLRQAGFEPFLRDYPAESAPGDAFERDMARIRPDVLVMNVNHSSLAEDIAVMDLARRVRPGVRILALAPFLAVPAELGEEHLACLKACDAALLAEYPEMAVELVDALAAGRPLEGMEGAAWWDAAAGRDVRTPRAKMRPLDGLPFPARDLLKNSLYVRPDTGRPQTIVQTSRGCPSFCTYCLTPALTGTQFVKRSVESVLAEVRECVERHGIRDIFFRADTFTMDRRWTLDFCRAIRESDLRFSWCCNSRVDRIDLELARAMKEAGNWLVAFGFESGSQRTLDRTRKGTTVEQNLEARSVCRQAGIRVFGQFLIGFPWETREDLDATHALVRRMRCDFIDVHFLSPYPGTPVSDEIPEGLYDGTKGFRRGALKGTAGGLSKADLVDYRRKMLNTTFLSPRAVLTRLAGIRSPREALNYARYGFKFLAGGYD